MTASSNGADGPRVFRAGEDLAAMRAAYERDGFVIVDGILTSPSSSTSATSDDCTSLTTLRRAAQDVVRLTRAGEWPHRRVVGKQFPPFDKVETQDYWGVQHLMHPSLPHHELFQRFYASEKLLDTCAALLAEQGVSHADKASNEQLQCELFNLLIQPQSHAFALGWHRDDVSADVSAQEEERLLRDKPTYGIQWNAALYDDRCLFLVPGTHKRVRTQEEVEANKAAPPPARKVESVPSSATDPSNPPGATGTGTTAEEGEDDARWSIDPPSTLRVELKAGQTAFYSQRILHRASYVPHTLRATLHGCYGVASVPPAGISGAASASADKASTGQAGTGAEEEDGGASERARMILQHSVSWMREPSFGESLPERLKPSEYAAWTM